MKKLLFIIKPACILLICLVNLTGCKSGYFSPVAVSADSLHQVIYIAGATANAVVAVNLNNNRIERNWKDLPSPSGIALLPDGSELFVTCSAPEGFIAVIDPATGKRQPDLPAGHAPMSPVISPDGKYLYICNRFDNDVWIIDIRKKTVLSKVPVLREPVALAVERTGRYLFVANHLPAEPANTGDVAAAISVIDLQAQKVSANIRLPDGSSSLRGLCLSPDDRYVFVTHILAHYQLPTTQLERGWMNTNALSIIDATTNKLHATVLLDDVDRGAANPWAVGCSPDGKYLLVTHAGTNELSAIDAAGLFEKLASHKQEDISTDLTFLVDIRHRMALEGYGPRSMAFIGRQVYIGDYFSDGLEILTVGDEGTSMARKLVHFSNAAPAADRKGEMRFNDASFCFQNWQSCASCHPDVRADGLNWDLLNDGVGNSKNTKSLLLSMQTPPSMISGIREHPEKAVRSGLKFIMFSARPEKEAVDIDSYLRGLKPIPSPYLQNGHLSDAAIRGKKLFVQSGCASCHPEPLFTDMKKYDVGTGTGSEKNRAFDTPSLVEIWRTAPYLYDGRAFTMHEVLTRYNADNRHGNVTGLNDNELKDLIEYIMSL